jgi:hypothetical protein
MILSPIMPNTILSISSIIHTIGVIYATVCYESLTVICGKSLAYMGYSDFLQ